MVIYATFSSWVPLLTNIPSGTRSQSKETELRRWISRVYGAGLSICNACSYWRLPWQYGEHWCEVFGICAVCNKEFSDSVYKTFDNLGRNKENNDAGRLLLAPLDKLTIEKDEFRDAIKQILVACGTVTKENRELSETTALLQCMSTV